MRTANILAVVLSCTAAAPGLREECFAQSPAEKPVNESYTYTTAPRFRPYVVKPELALYEPAYKNVKPPIQGMKVAWNVNEIVATKGAELAYASGTRITIPPAAFVDKEGSPVSGNVNIAYREFKNPLDFLLSGIPMGSDSAGTPGQFISAGMFEITASVNGKEVFLKPGAKVDVELASMDKNPDYNLYAFNDATGSWETKADKSTIKVTENTSAANSKAISNYVNYLMKNRAGEYDSTSCNERFESMDYFYTLNKQNGSVGKSRWSLGNGSYRSLVKIGNIRKAKGGEIVFKIARNNNYSHRELLPLQHVNWKLEEKLTAAEFKQLVSTKNNFYDVRITKTGDGYLIRLKSGDGFKEIKAVPVKVDEESMVSSYSQKSKDKMFTRYDKARKWREKYFDRQLARGKIENNRISMKPAERLTYAWGVAKKSMTSKEKEMNFEQWKEYVEDNPQLASMTMVAASSYAASEISRSLSISGMGIWNCDQIKRLRNPVQVMAYYKNEKGNPVRVSAAFIVDKKLNGVLQYYGMNQITFSKTAETLLIAITEDGEIAVVMPEYFRDHKFSKNTPHTFAVKELEPGAESIRELRELIGL